MEEEYTNYFNKGLSGLANLGNTCFLNSCMQALSHTYELNVLLESPTFHDKIKDCPEALLLKEWDGLKKILWSRNCIVAPHRFLKAVQKVADFKDMPMFTGFAQNDLPEFLIFVIQCFHESVCRKINMTITGQAENETDEIAIKCFEMVKQMYSKEYSETWNLFFAVHVSEIFSLTEPAKRLSIVPEPFFILDLPIPIKADPTIYDCFDLYTSGEILDGDNAWFNSESKTKMAVRKKLSFWSLPSILIIDFKRFTTRLLKNQSLISFPLENLDLSKYVLGYRKSSYKYDLYAVCNHSGSLLGGHYTVYVKNANGKWYHYNDTIVSEVGLNESIISSKAYVLFYRKKI